MVRDSREEWKTRQGVFDQFTERVLFKLSSQGYFDELKSILSPGKEAVVFKAHRKDGSPVAVKIYRLETARFSKMFDYLRVDPRYHNIKNNKRHVIFSWTEREFRNMVIARDAGVSCPTPIAFKHNVLVMEFIGHDEAAPMLRNAPPEDKSAFRALTMANVEKLEHAGYVHGDLSEYNILNHDEKPILIDFSHTIELTAPGSKDLLERDKKNLIAYFSKRF